MPTNSKFCFSQDWVDVTRYGYPSPARDAAQSRGFLVKEREIERGTESPPAPKKDLLLQLPMLEGKETSWGHPTEPGKAAQQFPPIQVSLLTQWSATEGCPRVLGCRIRSPRPEERNPAPPTLVLTNGREKKNTIPLIPSTILQYLYLQSSFMNRWKGSDRHGVALLTIGFAVCVGLEGLLPRSWALLSLIRPFGGFLCLQEQKETTG